MKEKLLKLLNRPWTIALALTLLIVNFHYWSLDVAIDSDTLWSYALFDDILTFGNRLSDWNLSQHSDFFPDKIMVFISWALTSNIEAQFFIYLVLNTILLAVAFYGLYFYGLYFFELYKDKLPKKYLTFAVLLSLGLFFYLPNLGYLRHSFTYFAKPSFHFSSFSAGFILLLAFISNLGLSGKSETKDSRLKLIHCLLGSFLVFTSDALIIVYCGAFLATYLFLKLILFKEKRKVLRSKRALIALGLFIITLIFSFLLKNKIYGSFAHLTDAHISFSIDKTLTNLNTFGARIWSKKWQLLVSLLLVSAIAFRFRRSLKTSLNYLIDDPKRKERLTLFLTLCLQFIILPTFVTLVLIPDAKYMLPLLFYGIGILGLSIVELMIFFEESKHPFQNIFQFRYLFFLPFLCFIPKSNFLKLFNHRHKNQLLTCLEKNFQKTHPNQNLIGLGGHWDGHLISAYSKYRYTVHVTINNLNVYHWVNNREQHRNKEYDFIIMSKELNHQWIKDNLGAPKTSFVCEYDANLGFENHNYSKEVWILSQSQKKFVKQHFAVQL